MTRNDLRAVVLECLKKTKEYDPAKPNYSVHFLFRDVAEIGQKRGLKTIGDTHNAWNMDGHQPEIHPNLRAPIREIVWDLIVEGILRPGSGSDEPSEWPFIHLTEFGRKAVTDHLTPYDPDGYLHRLREKVPALDDVIQVYLAESSETLRRHCLLSSTVMMGCASEKAMLLLFEKTADSCSPAKKSTLETALKKHRSIKGQNEEYRTWLENNLVPVLKKAKGTDWVSELDNALVFLFGYFRVMRNDAGHPKGAKSSREVVAGHLAIFPHHLRLIYDLMDWLDTSKPV